MYANMPDNSGRLSRNVRGRRLQRDHWATIWGSVLGISMASPTERNAAGLATVTEILRRGIGEIIKMLAMSAV